MAVKNRFRDGTKIRSIRDDLRRMAYVRGPGAKLPTARDLCASLGVHKATLDGALQELEARNIIVRRQGSGIYVSPNLHRKHIGIVLASRMFVASGASPFWGILLGLLLNHAQMRSKAGPQDFSFHLTLPEDKDGSRLPDALIKHVELGQIAGAIIVGLDRPLIDWLQIHELPCLGFSCPARTTVGIDGALLTKTAIGLLTERGCKRLAYWSPHNNGPSGLLTNLQQIRAEVEQARLEFFSELYLDYVALQAMGLAQKTHQEQGYFAALRVFSEIEAARPDGIFIADDMMTNGALKALETLGIRPGLDVQIVSSGNTGSPTLFGCEKQVAVIEYDPAEMVALMFSTLDQIMEGSDAVPSRIIVKHHVRSR